ncbi:MAG: ABC transporter permease subunit [Myxococcales bacterium]|nr:ABC transporter permease subunit [Myxococcales bacterium]
MTRASWPVAVASMGVGLAAWWLLAGRAGPLLLPRPDAVAVALWAERGRLAAATYETGVASLAGLLASSSLGVLAAAVGWWSPTARLSLRPWTVLVQVVPIVAIAPMLVVWLGYGRGVATVTAAIAAFYPVYSAAESGLRAPSAELVDLFRLYGASRGQELVRLRAWAALPALFSGLRTAAGLAVIGAIVGEFIGSNNAPPTLGYTVLFASRGARADLAFAAVVMAGALALGLNEAIAGVERRWIGRWYGN